ncbi:MAG: DUF305 domain-containing protein [Bacteroidota bacterium]
MKRIHLFTIAIAILLAACNRQKQQGENNSEKNVMMQAMDESMMAMHQTKHTGNADYDFAAMMIPHHKGAIVMAEAVIKGGGSPTLVNFANQVIEAQKREVAILNDFLKVASTKPAKNADQIKTALNNSMGSMMSGMSEAKLTGNIDKDFVHLMIPHHQSAVDMAKAYLPYARNDQLKKMAGEIIHAQEKEIKWLQTQ